MMRTCYIPWSVTAFLKVWLGLGTRIIWFRLGTDQWIERFQHGLHNYLARHREKWFGYK